MLWRNLSTLCAIAAMTVSVLAAPPRRSRTSLPAKPEPFKGAWEGLIPAPAERERRQGVTELAGMKIIMDEVGRIRRDCQKKTFAIRLRVIGAYPPKRESGPELALVHGQYVDKEYQDRFGKDATIGIWTRDHGTAEMLAVGDEIKLSGPVAHEVFYVPNDVPKYRLASMWSQKDIMTSVVYLPASMTGLPRDIRVYLVNPSIERILDDDNRLSDHGND